MSHPLIPQNPRKWWVLIATGLCLALSFLDQTAVVVILPTVQKALAASTLQMEWVVNSYMLVMAVLFVFGGRLGDLYSEKRIFLIGMTIFLIASIICGTSSSITMLILGRILQGIGSALIIPSQSVMIFGAFPVEERGRALGINLSIGSIFMILGGAIGGGIAQLINWQTVFWVNLPIGLISTALTIWAVMPDPVKQKIRIDWVGLFWQLLSITTLVFGIMELGHLSTGLCVTLFIIALISFYTLYKVEQKKTHPLISFHIFKIASFATGCIIIGLIQIVLITGIFGTLFYQDVLGVSPLIAGLMTLPGLLPVLFMGPVAGLLLDRFGARVPLLLGLTLLMFSCIWSAALLHLRSYYILLPGLFALGFGVPMVMNSIFTTALNAVELHNRGLASGTLGMLRQVGAAVGLAVTSAILNITNHWSIKTQLAQTHLTSPISTVESLFSMPHLLHIFPAAMQTALITIAKNALAIAINCSMLWSALIAIVMWLIAFIRTKNSPGFLKKDRA